MVAQGGTYSVLLVEDDPNHALLVKIAFQRGDPLAVVKVVQSAEEAIAYLCGPWPNVDAGSVAVPDVIVLDINMPGIGGLDFLEWLDRQPDLVHDIPVVVFTSSDDPELPGRCFALGAREFKEKPEDFMELLEVVRRVLRRWQPGQRGGHGASV